MNTTSLESFFDERAIPRIELAPSLHLRSAFVDPVTEHLATRRAAGLFDFSFMGCMEMKGPGSIALLEAIQPRSLVGLAVGRIRYTLLLRDNGTVLNDATVWRTGEQSWFLFVGRRADLSFVVDRAAAYDVSLDDRSDRLAVIALQGPRSRDVLSRCIEMIEPVPYYRFAEAEFERRRCLLANIGYSGEAGYEIVITADAAPDLWQAIRNAGVQECGFVAADTLRIEAGHMLFLNELCVEVTPCELGLERLVELLPHRRRAYARDPERRLVGLMIDEARPVRPETAHPSGGARPANTRADASGALLTSTCFSPTLERRIALGYVPWESRYPGTRVTAGSVRATVARLPFYDSGKRLVRDTARVFA